MNARLSMKCRNNYKLAIAAVGAWWLSNDVASAKAFHYGCAAQRDERNGFSYTAAREWRKAAECLLRRRELPSTAGGSGSLSCTCRGDWPVRSAFLAQRLFR